jgi:3-dehydroquinate dehydratase/shikimate dehydrogenase
MHTRHQRLATAALYYDRVELEATRDVSANLLSVVPVEKRLVSWHGPAETLTDLKVRFAQLSSVPASIYKLVTTAKNIRDEFTSLLLLKALDRSDTIAYSTGPLGFWSRLIALQLGAPAIFGLVPGGATDPGTPTIDRLIQDYGLPTRRPIRELFAIIGNPIFHSLSPRLHNAAYRSMNYPGLYVPLQVESFSEFWTDVVEESLLNSLDIRLAGLTVASPHKEAALLTARIISPIAREAESANLLVRDNGYWKADTTDPDIVFMANREKGIQMRHKRAAVIGCGGAGRAIAVALDQAGAGVTLVNRGPERGHHAAQLLGLPYIPLRTFDAEGYDIVVNATPVGRDDDDVPFQLEKLDDEVLVIDLVYGARPTPLVANRLAREQLAIDGRDVLLTQVLRQFSVMTGKEMPIGLALDVLGRKGTTSDSSSRTISSNNM